MFQKVKGFRDILGEDSVYWDRVEGVVKDVFKLFCVESVQIPILEYTSVFNRGIGQATDVVEKEMFTFIDGEDGDSVTLRPEGTAGVVRAYIENGLYSPPLLRRFSYYGPMFRRENPQKGRYRQFTQAGVEFLASASALTDADVINILVTFFNKVGLSHIVKLEINSVGCPECRPAYHKILIDYLSNYKGELCEDCNRRLDKNPLRVLDCKNEKCKTIVKDAPLMLDNLCVQCNTHFSDVQRYLKLLHIEYTINPLMVRGLDYYVRTAFEVVTDKLGAASAVGAGGRYDGLVETLGGPKTPGVGFAIGIDRVVALLKEEEGLENAGVDVFIVAFEDTIERGISVLNALRTHNIIAEIDYDIKGMKNQLKKADRSKAKYTIIIGADEVAQGKVMLRDMRKSEQELVGLDEYIDKIIKGLGV